MSIEASLDRFGDILESLDSKALMQTSFLESIYNMTVPMSNAIQNINGMFEKLVDLTQDQIEIDKEASEDLARAKAYDTADDSTKDKDTDKDDDDDKKEKDTKEPFSFLGLGLKGLLGAALASPFIYKFLRGFLNELFPGESGEGIMTEFENKLGEVFREFKDGVSEFIEFMKTVDWNALAEAITSLANIDWVDLITKIGALTTAIGLLRAAILAKNLLGIGGGAAAGAAGSSGFWGTLLRKVLPGAAIVAPDMIAPESSLTGQATQELQAEGIEEPTAAQVEERIQQIGERTTQSYESGEATPELTPEESDRAAELRLQNIQNDIESAEGRLSSVRSDISDINDMIEASGENLETLRTMPEWEDTLKEYDELIARQESLNQSIANSKEALSNTQQEIDSSKLARRNEILSRLDVIDAQDPIGVADDPANQNELDRLLEELQTLPVSGGSMDVNFPNAPEMMRGGIINASMQGTPAILHGTEAVLPLDDTRSVKLLQKTLAIGEESTAMSTRPAPVIVRGGDTVMGGSPVTNNTSTVVNNFTIDTTKNLNHVPQ